MATPKKTVKKNPAKKGDKKGGKNSSGIPKLKYPGDISFDPITGEQIVLDPFEDTNTTFDYDPITAGAITGTDVTTGSIKAGTLADRFMTAADYTMVDPTKISGEYGDIARSEMRKNSELSSELALDALDTELQGLQGFAPAAAALKRGEIALDNTFNQTERDRQLAAGDPSLRSDLEGQAGRARAYAEGRVPDSIQDRALELGLRSRAADSASGGGFGVGSSAARKASELMSAEARIGLSKYGDELLTTNIGTRAEQLLAPTQYSDAGSQIKVTPTQSAAQVALSIAGQANDKTIISSTDALSNLTNQEQFKTGIQQETNKFNTGLAADRDLNQANLNLTADTTNVGNQLNADLANQSNDLAVQSTNVANQLRAGEVNTSNAIQTQTTAMGIRSNESQFKSQLSFNADNANADRTFQSANINAGRSLEVATSNRNLRFEVQKTNKTMVFQDQQARRAEAGANARAAAASRASSGAAALNAELQREALAASIAMQREDREFQLTQQGQALDIFYANKEAGEDRNDAAVAGNIITRAPAVIGGVSTAITAVKDVYDSYSTPDTGGYNSDLNTTATPYDQGGAYDSGYEANYSL